MTWLQPKLVGEVAYAERTREGILRQASFMGLRQDIAAKSVGEEKAQHVESVEKKKPSLRITHPARVVWKDEGLTKLDLARYYEAVAGRMLPHLRNRPLTLVRCPDGVGGECFYQRHAAAGMKSFLRKSSKRGAYMYLDSAEALLSAVQNNAIELHTWGATVPDVRHPDRITMDLDPGEGVTWAKLAEAARLTKTLLEGLGLKCFLKTTGGKGLHVVAPIEPKLAWDEVKEFTRGLAGMLVKARPDLFVDTIARSKRGGRVFVDYLRNAETASAVAAYSARARPGAAVSMPLAWSELGARDLRAAFTVKSVPRRLARQRRDPWKDYAATRQSISRQALRAVAGSR